MKGKKRDHLHNKWGDAHELVIVEHHGVRFSARNDGFTHGSRPGRFARGEGEEQKSVRRPNGAFLCARCNLFRLKSDVGGHPVPLRLQSLFAALGHQELGSDPWQLEQGTCAAAGVSTFDFLIPLSQIQDVTLKNDWTALPQEEKDKYGYERDLMEVCARLVGQMDDRITSNKVLPPCLQREPELTWA